MSSARQRDPGQPLAPNALTLTPWSGLNSTLRTDPPRLSVSEPNYRTHVNTTRFKTLTGAHVPYSLESNKHGIADHRNRSHCYPLYWSHFALVLGLNLHWFSVEPKF